NASDDFVTLRVDNHPMTVVAIDGQPAEPFISRESRITLSPGNRTDVLIDATLKPSSTATIFVRKDDAEAPLARLAYSDGIVSPGASMPDGYASEPIPSLDATALPAKMDFRNALRPELAIEAAATANMPEKPLFTVARGRTVILAL